MTQRDKAAPVTAPVPADPDLPRTCVIGAGSVGLACAKNLYLAGVPFDCFEKGSRIGGNWLIDNPNGVSACYDHLEINTSVRRMAFSDFPMPADYPPYARHDQVAAYFDDYAEHFGLLPLITFDTEVTSVEPVAPGDQGGDAAGEMRGTGRWRVTTRGPGGEVTRDYDAVIVCNGHHWDPRLPDPAYPGQDEFAGEQIHAHSYRDASQLADRDVVVVGAGNSALDISSAAARTANSATISQRRGQWVIPKYTAGIASDLIAVPGWAPWLLNRIRLRVSSWTVRGLDKWGLPRPAHAPSQSHPVQSEEIRAALDSGKLTPKGAIERFDAEHVHFKDGTSVRADLVVWATGYKTTFPFLDESLVNARDNDLPLWKRAVRPDLPGLYFVGLLQPIGAVMPLAEAQAEWITEILAGDYAFPARAEIEASMRRDHERNKSRFYDSARHTMEVDFDSFLFDLARERRRGRRRRRRAEAGVVTGGAGSGTRGSGSRGGAAGRRLVAAGRAR
ncbi:flavin-containing monooxygenase [Corynebacterium frankenforstense]